MAKTQNWTIAPHTAAKHDILRRYLGGWFPILSARGFQKKLNFIDGFAGRGRYDGGEPGSPIIALSALVDHQHFDRWSGITYNLVFVEKDDDNFANLAAEIDAFWAARPGGCPRNVKVTRFHGSFEEAGAGILESIGAGGGQLAPTFALVDPFGWSGVPLDLIGQLVAFPKCEIFFNFMYDSINRRVNDQRAWVQQHLTDTFGTDAYKQAHGMLPAARKAFLHDLYGRQLEEVVGCTYIRSFEMIGMDGHTTYSLFFGTKHPKGLEVMKDAMWKLDPETGSTFSDRLAGEEVLFQPEPDLRPLRKAILEEFGDRDHVRIEDVEAFVGLSPYLPRHLRKPVLIPMQNEGLLVPLTQARPRQFPAGTVFRLRRSAQ